MTIDALAIIQEAIQAVDPSMRIKRHVHVDPLTGICKLQTHLHALMIS
jgi:hypothetical protein